MLAEIRTTIREEIMEVRRDLTALEHRVEDLEPERTQTLQHQQATDMAATRQGNVLLDLVEDLDNRGWRNNNRIKGLPESTGEALQELLTGLFTHILGDRALDDYGIERAHIVLRPPSAEGPPRDVICCLLSFAIKDMLMKETRAQQSITYMDAQVSLFQDLSTFTLEAKRAFRPLTTLMLERRIPYNGGFPFSLQAKVGNSWHIIRWPANVPSCAPPASPLYWSPIGSWKDRRNNDANQESAWERRGGPDGPEE
ncbi:Hypothetical predicted protein [Pelobates cultripes]|uniref:Uncharacterized protein n=1 Tax=Pelobates cultripes TaxID=61616 RepID=A0AAD1WUS2_PELCU|nr:Hypothetical predicted protein [Pelobates cultripes]